MKPVIAQFKDDNSEGYDFIMQWNRSKIKWSVQCYVTKLLYKGTW